MTNITSTRTIPFSKEKIWEIIDDFENIHVWNPGVKSSYSTSTGKPTGKGAQRHCDLAPFGSFEERITIYEPHKKMGIDIYEGAKLPPIKNMKAQLDLEELGKNSTKVSFSFSYDTKGLMGKIMNPIMVKPKMIDGTENFLKGLEHYIKTGKKITKSELKKVI
ncbi:SRPBCC family protein [uncultured Aquimarina sp.]|uniref:SRPBCC family protein n=1 Tax=uncultured Aquimarina sp. TaxID=575652 RepID=UPI002620AE78|nr:SRPBCC family protein [uncultured Aquimarina sp.]